MKLQNSVANPIIADSVSVIRSPINTASAAVATTTATFVSDPTTATAIIISPPVSLYTAFTYISTIAHSADTILAAGE